jgi:hypothetical protein
MVRAKFKVESITQYESGYSVQLKPVTFGSKENESFFKWTPYGNLEMGFVSSEIVKQFEVNKEYYIDFIKAE